MSKKVKNILTFKFILKIKQIELGKIVLTKKGIGYARIYIL